MALRGILWFMNGWGQTAALMFTVLATAAAVYVGLSGQIGELRTDVRRLDDRLRSVEVSIATYHGTAKPR